MMRRTTAQRICARRAEQLFKHSDVTTAVIAVMRRQRNLGRLLPQWAQQQPGTRVRAGVTHSMQHRRLGRRMRGSFCRGLRVAGLGYLEFETTTATVLNITR